MPVKRQGWLILLVLSMIGALETGIVLSNTSFDISLTVVRLLGLYGFTMLCTATSITFFLKEVTQFFGRPFLKVHHGLAAFGIVFITLHPVWLALKLMDTSVFLPKFDSWLVFWSLAGRPALLLLYVAVLGALLRRRATRYWRSLHVLIYIVLLLGTVHANLIGTDFQNVTIVIVLNSFFAVSMSALILKRYRSHQVRKRLSLAAGL